MIGAFGLRAVMPKTMVNPKAALMQTQRDATAAGIKSVSTSFSVPPVIANSIATAIVDIAVVVIVVGALTSIAASASNQRK